MGLLITDLRFNYFYFNQQNLADTIVANNPLIAWDETSQEPPSTAQNPQQESNFKIPESHFKDGSAANLAGSKTNDDKVRIF